VADQLWFMTRIREEEDWVEQYIMLGCFASHVTATALCKQVPTCTCNIEHVNFCNILPACMKEYLIAATY